MRIRRLAVAGVALAAVIGLTGCGPTARKPVVAGASPSTQASPPPDPAAELAAAANTLADDSLRMRTRMTTGLNADGQVSKGADQMSMTMSITAPGAKETTVSLRKVGTDLYMKFAGPIGAALGANKDKWLHVDVTKVPPGSPFSVESNDPRSAAKLIAASSQVQKTDQNSFKGVLDMTKSATANQDSLRALGAKATAVPFTARKDAAGHLVELVVDVEAIAAGAGQMTTTYSDFGVAVTVESPPASQVAEMPKEMLGLLGA